MTTEDLAYFAGLFDGEGCVQIYKRTKSGAGKTTPYQIRATMTNTVKCVIDDLAQAFG